MWSLLMGAAFSSDEDESKEDTANNQELVDAAAATSESQERSAAGMNSDSLARLHKDVEKHRIPSPTRERGDGSEEAVITSSPRKVESSTVNVTPSATNVKKTDPSTAPSSKPKLIHLPKTNIRLEKLPPISRDNDVDLPKTEPSSPLVQMLASNPVRLEKGFSGSRKDKDPKFVPYEPYKAAVTQMVAKKKKSLRTSPPKDVKGATANQEIARPQENNLDEQQEAEKGRYAIKSLKQKENEIDILKRELADKEKQLRIQTQVNCEVKRLLIASVGEDIEAKVDFLTQDKARLSADIRHYASKISRDFEEKENLSVESTLWKSKFLACSVIVDELARWKATLLHRSEEHEHNIRLLLHEHTVMWSTMMDTYDVLSSLRTAFDPLSSSSLRPAEAASLLGMVDHTFKLTQLLRERLVGETGLKGVKGQAVLTQLDTPSVEALKRTMAKPLSDGDKDYSEMASIAVTGAAKLHLTKLGDKLSTPSGGFKSCTHCHGNVQNL